MSTSGSNVTLFDNVTIEITTPEPYIKPFYEYDIVITADWIFFNSWKIYAPPGILGNLIVIIVTSRMKPFNSSSFFMTSLAAVDLVLVCFRIPFKVRQIETTAMCKLFWYLNNALPVYSNYILVFWTIERFIAVQFPLRVAEWCSLRNTALSVTGVGIFAFLFSLPWVMSTTKSLERYACVIPPDWSYFIYQVWFYFDLSFFVLIPMLTIFLCNIAIIFRLKQSTERHKEMTSSEESRKNREKEQRNLTISLLTVSFAFLILHTPYAVYNCIAFLRHGNEDQAKEAVWVFVNAIGLIIAEVQNSVNFYLYFLSGRRYRQQTLQLFMFCRKRKSARDKVGDSSTNVTALSVSTVSKVA